MFNISFSKFTCMCNRKPITSCPTLTMRRSLEGTVMIIWMKPFTEAGDGGSTAPSSGQWVSLELLCPSGLFWGGSLCLAADVEICMQWISSRPIGWQGVWLLTKSVWIRRLWLEDTEKDTETKTYLLMQLFVCKWLFLHNWNNFLEFYL